VPLGTFSGADVKTVLLKVRVPHDREGAEPVANVELTYRDLATASDGRCGGKLGIEVVPNGSDVGEFDSVVSGRVQRSETASVLKDANVLFEQGRAEEARRRLAQREQALRAAADKAKGAAPPARAKDVDRDFASQVAAVDDANNRFATPPPQAGAPALPRPATRAGKSAVKENQERAVQMGF
jgi:Ca-activated chloride channel family protein